MLHILLNIKILALSIVPVNIQVQHCTLRKVLLNLVIEAKEDKNSSRYLLIVEIRMLHILIKYEIVMSTCRCKILDNF